MVGKQSKLKLHDLAILGWLSAGVGSGGRFIIADHDSGFRFYETSEKDDDGKGIARLVSNTSNLDGDEAKGLLKSLYLPTTSPSYQPLLDRKFVSTCNGLYGGDRLKEFLDKISNLDSRNVYRANLVRLTKQGFEYWQGEGESLHDKMRKKHEAEIAEVTRFVLVGKKIKREFTIDRKRIPEGLKLTLPVFTREFTDPAFYARVVKETDTRVYVDDVKDVSRNTRHFGDGFNEVRYKSLVSGNDASRYVSKEDIIKDPATPEDVERLKRLNDEYADDFERIAKENLAEIEAILRSMGDRLAQKQAEHDDMVRELLGDAGREDAPKP